MWIQVSNNTFDLNVEMFPYYKYLKNLFLCFIETNQSIVLGVLPMFHIYGMVVVLLESLKHGDKVVTLPKFDPIMFKEALVKKKVKSNLIFLKSKFI